MTYIRPIPVKKENIKIGNQYYTCNYSGSTKVTILKIFDDGAVLVKTKNDKCKPFVRSMKYIFDSPDMANSARRSWENDKRKGKKGKRNNICQISK